MRRAACRLLLLALVAGVAACAAVPPAPGTTRDALLQAWGPPTAVRALAGGGQRLEYATGPYGRSTWMVDLDVAGRVARARQVLNEAEFQDVLSTPGLRGPELLLRLGTPGERRRVGWRGDEVWSWRYPTNDCLWFEAVLATDGRVTGGGYGIDPRCDMLTNEP